MHYRYHHIFYMLLIVAGLLLSGCDHIELDYPGTTLKPVPVKVEFNWANDPEADPSGMAVYFFRLDTKTKTKGGKLPPAAFDFKGRDGGLVSITPGTYAVICHNNDSDRHGYVGYNVYEEFGLSLTNMRDDGRGFNFRSVKARDFGDERIATEPDNIWISSVDIVEIATASERGEIQVISLDMQSVVHTYTFIVRKAVNYNPSVTLSAAVSGMAGTVHPGLGVTGDETVIHTFGMRTTSSGGLIGKLLTFGHCSGKQIGSRQPEANVRNHSFVVSAILEDGTSWYSAHDVTEKIHTYPHQDVVVTIDSIVFPKPVVESGGFIPTVEDWVGETVIIGM